MLSNQLNNYTSEYVDNGIVITELKFSNFVHVLYVNNYNIILNVLDLDPLKKLKIIDLFFKQEFPIQIDLEKTSNYIILKDKLNYSLKGNLLYSGYSPFCYTGLTKLAQIYDIPSELIPYKITDSKYFWNQFPNKNKCLREIIKLFLSKFFKEKINFNVDIDFSLYKIIFDSIYKANDAFSINFDLKFSKNLEYLVYCYLIPKFEDLKTEIIHLLDSCYLKGNLAEPHCICSPKEHFQNFVYALKDVKTGETLGYSKAGNIDLLCRPDYFKPLKKNLIVEDYKIYTDLSSAEFEILKNNPLLSSLCIYVSNYRELRTLIRTKLLPKVDSLLTILNNLDLKEPLDFLKEVDKVFLEM